MHRSCPNLVANKEHCNLSFDPNYTEPFYCQVPHSSFVYESDSMRRAFAYTPIIECSHMICTNHNMGKLTCY